MAISDTLAEVLEGSPPEWQDQLAKLIYDMGTYESFGNHALMAFVDADGGYVVQTEPRNPCQS